MTEPTEQLLLPPPTPPASAPRRGKRRAIIWLMVFLVAAVAVWYEGWYVLGQKTTDKGKNKASPVIITTVSRTDIPVQLDALGTVQAYNTVSVHSRVDGELMTVNFTEGQMVKKGDILAKIDERPFRAQRDQAAANLLKDQALLSNTKRDLERYQGMGDAISKQTLDTQQATVKETIAAVAGDKAALENAQTQLDYCTIRAPMDGRTGISDIDPGNIVHASDTTALVVITQLQPINIFFSLPQQELPQIMTRMEAGVKLPLDALDADRKTVIDSGVLDLVDNEIDQTTGTIRLKSDFPNKNLHLWPGAFVNARLYVSTHAQAIVIPTVAVQRGPKGSYVFRYDGDKKEVTLVPVTVGIINGEQTEILDGLNVGDKIVTDGMAKLQDHTKVRLSKSEHHSEDGAPAEKSTDPTADKTTDAPAMKTDDTTKDQSSDQTPAPVADQPVKKSHHKKDPSADGANNSDAAPTTDSAAAQTPTHRTIPANQSQDAQAAPVAPDHTVHDLSHPHKD